MGSIDDISQLCRLCLVKDQVNIPIFNETSDIEQIFVKINSCLPVKVSRDDNLPKKICDGCSYKLDMLYIFRNTSLDSEKQLIQWLDEAGLNSAPSEQTEVDPLANPLTSTKPEIMVKQETIEPSESRGEGDNSEICMDAQNYIIQQQKLPYEQDFDFGEPSGSSAGLMTDEPAPKRAKRTAAIKKAPLETVEDDLDAAMQITKAEEEDSDEVDQPDYVEPSTSADDQPGPSGVGKPAVEAPQLGQIKVEADVADAFPIKQEPQSRTYPCDVCGSIFKTKRAYNSHYGRAHTSKKNQCSFCNRKFNTREKLDRHTAIHPEAPKIRCEACDLTFTTRYELRRHKKRHYRGGKMCCGRFHRTEESYQKHLDVRHNTSHTCETCGKVFDNRTYYNAHVKRHIIKPYGCKQCGRRFGSSYALKYHVEGFHEGRRYLCETCGKELRCPLKLNLHKRVHTGEKPYICETCDKGFARKETLVMHSRVHTKEKPYECELCYKCFTQRSSLNLHIRGVHKKEKAHECVICSKSFVSRSFLNVHMKVHAFKDE